MASKSVFFYQQHLWYLQFEGLKLGWRWLAYLVVLFLHKSCYCNIFWSHHYPKIGGTHPTLSHVRSYSAKFISKFQVTLVAKLSTYVAAQYYWRHYRSTTRVGDTSLFPASYRSLKEIWLLDIAHLQLPMHACLLILAICQLNISYRQSNSINIGNFLYNLSKIDTYITLSTMFTVMSFQVDLFSLSVNAGIVTRHNRKKNIWRRWRALLGLHRWQDPSSPDLMYQQDTRKL